MTNANPANSTVFSPERMQNLTATHVGEVGEFLVASILGGFGFEVVKTNGKGYDLIVMPRSEGQRPIRVDVKTKASSEGPRIFNIKKGKKTTYRDYDPSDCDVFALVCLEDLSLTFKKCSEFAGKRSIYLNRDEHKATDPYASWVDSLTAI